MNQIIPTVSILKSDADLVAHEKALFRNFYSTYPDYAQHFFEVIDRKRLRPLIPYESQVIYGLKYNEKLCCAGSFCIDTSQRFEIEEMGFRIDKSDSVCEGLHLYSTITSEFCFDIAAYRKLLRYALDDLMKKNFTTIYSSCSEKLIKLYRFAGFSVIDDLIFYHEREYLLKMDIAADFEKNIFDLDRIK